MHSLFTNSFDHQMIVVAEIARVLEEKYLNPFQATLCESCLYNLSPGEVLPAAIVDNITKCYSKG